MWGCRVSCVWLENQISAPRKECLVCSVKYNVFHMSLTILYCDDDTCRLHAWFVIQWTAMMRTFSFGTTETWSTHCAHQVQGEGCGGSNGIQSMAMQCWQPACMMVSTFSISFLAKVRKLSMFLFKNVHRVHMLKLLIYADWLATK